MTSKTKPKKRKKMSKQAMWLVLGSAGALALIAWIFIGGGGQQLTASGAKLVHTMDPNYFSKDRKRARRTRLQTICRRFLPNCPASADV